VKVVGVFTSYVGTVFVDRKALSACGIHRPPMAGIHGNPNTGAISIVLSWGYTDDVDNGDEILYTGSGKTEKGLPVADQVLEGGNGGLAKSSTLQNSIRVSRGSNLNSVYAPASGYRYDGLYVVDSYWQETTASGFKVWRYKLKRKSGQLPLPDPVPLDQQQQKKKSAKKAGFTSLPKKLSSPFQEVKESTHRQHKKRKVSTGKRIEDEEEDSDDDDIFDDGTQNQFHSKRNNEDENNNRSSNNSHRRIAAADFDSQFAQDWEQYSLTKTFAFFQRAQCFICKEKPSDLQRWIAHLEKHQSALLRTIPSHHLFMLNVRSSMNQYRIRSVLETVEDQLDAEFEQASSFGTDLETSSVGPFKDENDVFIEIDWIFWLIVYPCSW